jgi:hypothetical protein
MTEMTETTASTSLLDLLLSLFRSPEALAAYKEDPQGFLSSCVNISPADVRDALVLLEDSQEAEFSRDYNTGPSHTSGSYVSGNHVQVPPPPPPPERHVGESDHEAAVRYLNTYITNNYVDDRDTVIDNSVKQQIDTGGGDFDQDIDIDSVAATGDGAVAAGGDIEDSTVVAGDGNQVGDGNIRGDGNVVGDNNDVIRGDDNTAAFGNGDANTASFEDVKATDGGALAVGGNAAGGNAADGSFNEAETTTTTTTEYDDSFNQDTGSASDSFNQFSSGTDVDSHNSTDNDVQSHNDLALDS